MWLFRLFSGLVVLKSLFNFCCFNRLYTSYCTLAAFVCYKKVHLFTNTHYNLRLSSNVKLSWQSSYLFWSIIRITSAANLFASRFIVTCPDYSKIDNFLTSESKLSKAYCANEVGTAISCFSQRISEGILILGSYSYTIDFEFLVYYRLGISCVPKSRNHLIIKK